MTGQSSEPHTLLPTVAKRYSFPVGIFLRRRGLRAGRRSWQGHWPGEAPLLRFCLSPFRPRSTTSKPIGPRWMRNSSCADARFVCEIPSSAMAAAANRLMMNTMIGSGFGAAFAIAAARRSRSCRPFLRPTVTTASSPVVKRYGVTSWKAVPGKPQRPRSKIPIAWSIPPPCAGGSGVWILPGRRFGFCAGRRLP